MTHKNLAWVSLSALLCAVPTAKADEFINFAPPVRDFVASNAGNEVAMPLLNFGDSNADGIPDMTLLFNVYAAGTNTKLLATPLRRVNIPTVPCSNPALESIDRDWKAKFLGSLSVSRIHAVVQLEIGCWDLTENVWKEAQKTFVYSTDASVVAGTTWAKAYNYAALAFDGVDWDADGTTELMLSLGVPTDTAGTNNARILFIHPATGTVEADNAYPAVIGDF